MSRKLLTKYVLLGLLSIIAGVAGISAQDKSCALKVEVSRNDNDAPVSGAAATAYSVRTREIHRAANRDGLSFFAELSEGEYRIAVTRAGYKKSLLDYVLTCTTAENGVATTSVPLWPGSPKQNVWVNEEIQTLPPIPVFKVEPKPAGANAGILNDKATNLVKPAYPEAAKAVRAAGEVKVQVTLDEQGDVISAEAVSGHPLLRTASVKAARESKFPPTLLDGQPVKVTGVIVYNFVP